MSHNDVTRQVAKQLQSEGEQIRLRLARLGEILRIEVNPDTDEADFTLEEHEITLTLMHELESRLALLERALQRIEQGAYGLCERCGEPIDPARLEILPETTLCVKCKRIVEKETGMRMLMGS
jgi:DnaK suppressor protein